MAHAPIRSPDALDGQTVETNVQTWSVREAAARFNALLDICLKAGPQVISRDGTEVAVLVPIEDWRRLQQASGPILKELSLADRPRGDIRVPARGRSRRRSPPSFN